VLKLTWELRCPNCGFSKVNEYEPFCPRCHSPLELKGEIPKPKEPLLGEGNTPIVKVKQDSAQVIFKLEYLNPSGSFKDRGTSLSVWLAKKLNYKCVVEDSSGNTGLSVAMYSSYLGLKSYIVIPKTAGIGKKKLLKTLGANVIEAETREKASEIAEKLSTSCFYVAHSYSPIFIEGMKTIAKELKDYGDWNYIVPVSSGTLILGIYRGLRELGFRPRIYAVQAAEAASLKGHVRLIAEVGGRTSKLADALVLKKPPRLNSIIEVVNDSGGGLIVVGDEAIKSSVKELLSMGFIIEPSSATVWAAYKALRTLGMHDDFVLPLTGSGLKYYEVLAELG
jgi:threonine synthase